MIQKLARASVTFAIMLGLALMTLAWAGCSGSARHKTLHATLVAVDAARDGFVAYDLVRQNAIVDTAESREAMVERLAAYRHDRGPIVEAFAETYKLIAAALALDEDRSLKAALAAAEQLANTLAAFGCDRCKAVSP